MSGSGDATAPASGSEPDALLIARPLPSEAAGLRSCLAHVFPLPEDGATVLRAYCGAKFARDQLEVLDKYRGQPCFRCMMRVPDSEPHEIEQPRDP